METPSCDCEHEASSTLQRLLEAGGAGSRRRSTRAVKREEDGEGEEGEEDSYDESGDEAEEVAEEVEEEVAEEVESDAHRLFIAMQRVQSDPRRWNEFTTLATYLSAKYMPRRRVQAKDVATPDGWMRVVRGVIAAMPLP